MSNHIYYHISHKKIEEVNEKIVKKINYINYKLMNIFYNFVKKEIITTKFTLTVV